MKQPLPYAGFKWLTESEIASTFSTKDAILTLPEDGPDGYFLEVDLDYPQELHDAHAEYPLAPEQVKVKICKIMNCTSYFLNIDLFLFFIYFLLLKLN